MESPVTQWQKAWKDNTFHPDLPHPNVEHKLREALLPYIPANGTILDLGAGTGNMRYLPDSFNPSQIHTVDVSEDALSLNPSGKKTLADIRKPITDQTTYDLVMSMFVLSSFPVEDQILIIQNALPRVKPGGMMIHVDFRDQASRAVKMHPFDIRALVQRLNLNGIQGIITQNIYPECYDEEDYTHYEPLDMLGIHTPTLVV